jgi:hypothetical protein
MTDSVEKQKAGAVGLASVGVRTVSDAELRKLAG